MSPSAYARNCPKRAEKEFPASAKREALLDRMPPAGIPEGGSGGAGRPCPLPKTQPLPPLFIRTCSCRPSPVSPVPGCSEGFEWDRNPIKFPGGKGAGNWRGSISRHETGRGCRVRRWRNPPPLSRGQGPSAASAPKAGLQWSSTPPDIPSPWGRRNRSNPSDTQRR